jgi:hypothetical protein
MDPIDNEKKTKMIEKLTPEQEAQLDNYRDKWIKIGLSTEPLNVEAAKDAARRSYKEAGLECPEQFYIVKSPHEAIVAIHLLKIAESKNNDVHDPSALDGVDYSKYDLKDVGDANNILSEHMFGSHDASWLSFYDFFLTECGLKECEPLIPLMDMAQKCGWWAAYDTCVILQERPSEIHLDESNVLHNEKGPAILYPDGYSVYSWRGVTVPGEWIDDTENLSAQTAITWENIEQRRAACEIKGWHHILDELDTVEIDVDSNPEIGTLLEVDLKLPESSGKDKFLYVKCGTGRHFAIPVPPEMKTAIEANSWTYGIDPVDYKPEVRT